MVDFDNFHPERDLCPSEPTSEDANSADPVYLDWAGCVHDNPQGAYNQLFWGNLTITEAERELMGWQGPSLFYGHMYGYLDPQFNEVKSEFTMPHGKEGATLEVFVHVPYEYANDSITLSLFHDCHGILQQDSSSTNSYRAGGPTLKF